MATKLKKHNPVLAFTVYFLSLSVFLGCLGGSIVLVLTGGMAPDYKQTGGYRSSAVAGLVKAGYSLAADVSGMDREQAWTLLDSQGGNIAYLIYGSSLPEPVSSGTAARTADEFFQEIQQGLEDSRQNMDPFAVKSSNVGYDHLLMIEGDEIYEDLNYRTGHESTRSNVAMSRYGRWFDFDMSKSIGGLGADDAVICLAVRSEGAFTNNYGSIYTAYYNWFQMIIVSMVVMGAGLFSLLVFLVVRLRKQSMAIARAKLAAFTGWFWVEVKAVALFLLCACAVVALSGGYAESVILLYIFFWGMWLLWNDLRRNKASVFRHNIINSVKELLTRFDSKYPFCARMKRRLLFLILAEAALALLALFLLLLFEGGFGIVLDLFLVALGLFLLVHFINTYNRDVDAFAAIIDYTAKIRAGTAAEQLRLPPENAFAPLAADLNDIHSGLSHMVEEQVRSEKMKVELITNVSHDLKTPLTSIINYVDLLSKETLAPEFANDYVKVLQGKAERLKNLVQDLFEISKANSGAIDLNLEQLNVQSLVEQTVAELDQRTEQAGVEIKLQLAAEPLVVRADGKKLHRVFENLLGNALKYSLAGTRVYIDVARTGGDALITFKNVAGYEMTFTADEIVERFQRGDTSRTSEGSGLGLAIAKSFLELCGGSLRIELDGDLFKAIVRLPLYVPYEQRALHTQEAPAAPLAEAPQAAPAEAVQQPFFREAEGGGLVSGPYDETASGNEAAVEPALEQADAAACEGREMEGAPADGAGQEKSE